MYIFVHRVIYEAQRYKLSARFYYLRSKVRYFQ